MEARPQENMMTSNKNPADFDYENESPCDFCTLFETKHPYCAERCEFAQYARDYDYYDN